MSDICHETYDRHNNYDSHICAEKTRIKKWGKEGAKLEEEGHNDGKEKIKSRRCKRKRKKEEQRQKRCKKGRGCRRKRKKQKSSGLINATEVKRGARKESCR